MRGIVEVSEVVSVPVAAVAGGVVVGGRDYLRDCRSACSADWSAVRALASWVDCGARAVGPSTRMLSL